MTLEEFNNIVNVYEYTNLVNSVMVMDTATANIIVSSFNTNNNKFKISFAPLTDGTVYCGLAIMSDNNYANAILSSGLIANIHLKQHNEIVNLIQQISDDF